jgi:hypothetical protein
LGSAAGAPLAQHQGTEADRRVQESAGFERRADAADRADAAAGVGTTEEDQATGERDADGRRPWEAPVPRRKLPAPEAESPPPSTARDPTGQCGGQLDLSG